MMVAVWGLLAYIGAAAALLAGPRSRAVAPPPSRRLRALESVHVVVFTGYEDMRVDDHGGICGVASDPEATGWLPLCVVESGRGVRFDKAATELDAALRERYGAALARRAADGSDLGEMLREACEEVGATDCHVVGGLVESQIAEKYDAALETLTVKVHRWTAPLRGDTWQRTQDDDKSFDDWRFPAYVDYCRSLKPLEPIAPPSEMPPPLQISSSGGTSNGEGGGPYAHVALRFSGCQSADKGLLEYMEVGRRVFASTYLGSSESVGLYGATCDWIAGEAPGERMAQREPAELAFAAALAVGAVSPRRLVATAGGASVALGAGGPLEASDGRGWPLRSEGGLLADVAEWREWWTRLALADDARYWRWAHGQYQIRYKNYNPSSTSKTTMLLVHGFGASSDQWDRLSTALLLEKPDDLRILAFDLVGFGKSAKPGLSYTQHLWEAQITDFCHADGGEEYILVGNSIGGGLCAGAVANLGGKAKGLVLCNTAGTIADSETPLKTDVASRTLGGALTAYSPPPGGQRLLDAFGQTVIELLTPQVPTLLKKYYPTNPGNADDELASRIERDALDPGAANVIGSGAKLPEQRQLDEVLNIFSGPILVAQGEFDYVSGPERTLRRAEQIGAIREQGITVNVLNSGHCPHDESPDLVAASILQWLDKEHSDL